MSIQWYPGHMNAAKKKAAEQMENTDLVIEVLDARLPEASCNPMVEELRLFRQRPCLKILNKVDLADPAAAAVRRAGVRGSRASSQSIVATGTRNCRAASWRASSARSRSSPVPSVPRAPAGVAAGVVVDDVPAGFRSIGPLSWAGEDSSGQRAARRCSPPRGAGGNGSPHPHAGP